METVESNVAVSSIVVGLPILIIGLILLMRSTYFTIPRIRADELKDLFKTKIKQSLMDIREEEADLLAQIMIDVLNSLN